MRGKRIGYTVAALVALAVGVTAPEAAAVRLDEAQIFIEINDTDGDAGIQVFLDGEGWRLMKVFDPDGNKVLDFRARGGVRMQGITELALESAEPSFEEQPLDEFLALFPPGRYIFEGMTTENEPLTGRGKLTHKLPAAPNLVRPVDGDDEVDPDDTVVEWALVADPAGSEIIGYQVIVDTDEPRLMIFTADVGPEVTSITVPPEFMQPETEYAFEVIAIERSGNKTISEGEFETE